MGYFKGINQAGFFEREDGRVEYFPWGIFAPGYVLSAESAQKVKKKIAVWNAVALPTVIVISVLVSQTPLYWLYIPLVLLSLVSIPLLKRVLADELAGAERTQSRMKLVDNAQNMAEGQGKLVTGCLFAMALVMTAGGLFLLFIGTSSTRWTGLLAVVFFGFALWLFGLQFAHLMRRKA
ncbi:hypothetical protein EON82_17200 [bacterium]|nr:MAG: hypothetical protein EON82_17200 [bacterium]